MANEQEYGTMGAAASSGTTTDAEGGSPAPVGGDVEAEAASISPTTTDTDAATSVKDVAEEVVPVRKHRWRLYAAAALCAAVLLIVLAVALALKLREYYDGNDDNELSGPRVVLNYTTYVGTTLPTNVNQFLGMRYAAPPLGDLRWRAPVAPNVTNTVEPATEFGSVCFGTNYGYPVGGLDEDCLFVNVWTPSNATAESKLPVWVFIQGGGYTANTNANWGGADVVRNSGYNIVMLDFNYRAGLWGFLASEKVKENGDLNVGLLDQRQLLLWVKQYISQFGGDPDHVVIHGASAGAGSVVLHMTAYGGRDDHLFVGGVAESVFFPAQPYLSELEWQFDRLSQAVGCNDTADQMACLRGKDTGTLQTANVASPFPGRTGPPMPLFYWTPCVDGDLIEDLPYTMLAKGRFIRVPIMFGDDTDEGSVFVSDASSEADFTTFMQDNYPLLAANDTVAILDQYPPLPAVAGHGAWFPTLSQAYGEATFTCPAINLLTMFSGGVPGSNTTTYNGTTGGGGSQAWSYRYDVQDDGNTAAGLGVPHLFEAAAVFGPGNIGGGAAQSYYTYNAAVVPVVMAYWISFVRALDPNAYRDAAAPVWESWGGGGSGSGGKRIVMRTGNMTMEDVPLGQMARCAFWQSLAGVTEQRRKKS